MKFFNDQAMTDIITIVKGQSQWGRNKLKAVIEPRFSEASLTHIAELCKPVDKQDAVLMAIYTTYIGSVDKRLTVTDVECVVARFVEVVKSIGPVFNREVLKVHLKGAYKDIMDGHSTHDRNIVSNAITTLIKSYEKKDVNSIGCNMCSMLLVEYITYEVSKFYFNNKTVKPVLTSGIRLVKTIQDKEVEWVYYESVEAILEAMAKIGYTRVLEKSATRRDVGPEYPSNTWYKFFIPQVLPTPAVVKDSINPEDYEDEPSQVIIAHLATSQLFPYYITIPSKDVIWSHNTMMNWQTVAGNDELIPEGYGLEDTLVTVNSRTVRYETKMAFGVDFVVNCDDTVTLYWRDLSIARGCVEALDLDTPVYGAAITPVLSKCESCGAACYDNFKYVFIQCTKCDGTCVVAEPINQQGGI